MAKNLLNIGQSNMVGISPNAGLQAQYSIPNSSVKIWTGTSFDTLDSTIPNNQYPSGTGTGTFGSEYSLGYKLQAYYNDTIRITKYSYGGTSLATDALASGDWSITSRGELYDKATSVYNESVVPLWNSKLYSTLDAIIWMQGEQDSRYSASANAYETNLTNFIAQIRRNTRSNVPFILCRIHNSLGSAVAATITGATNATPIVITAASHGLTTGDQVTINGVTGNTAANGTFTITVVNSSSFSLNSSVGNGAYVSGGTVCKFPFSSTVRTAQANIISATPNCYMIDTDSYSLQADSIHFDAAGYEQMGLDLKNQFIALYP